MSKGPLVPPKFNYLGKYMEKLRKKNGFSREYVAEKLGMTSNALYRLEDGYSIPRDKAFIRRWVKICSNGKAEASMAMKLSMITYPEAICKLARMGIDDRIRFLALIQEIHLTGMPEAVAKAIDSSIINPQGTVIRMKNTGPNVAPAAVGGQGGNTRVRVEYEDFRISPDLEVDESEYLIPFLSQEGDEMMGASKSREAFDANDKFIGEEYGS